jgi:hypothetical protein
VTFKVIVCVICETSTCTAADFWVLNICSMIHLGRSSAKIAGVMHRVGRVGHALLGPSDVAARGVRKAAVQRRTRQQMRAVGRRAA